MGVPTFPWRSKRFTADGQVSNAKTILGTVTINRAATTAGTITIYDSLTETGTIITAIRIDTATNGQTATTLHFDRRCLIGLYVGFDGTIVAGDITVTYE